MLIDQTIATLSEGLRSKKFSSEDLVRECYNQIEKHEKDINAFITVIQKDTAIKKARDIDNNISRYSSAICGIPFTLKDAYVTKGVRTTAASSVLKEYIPQYDATVYKRLTDAGAILIGKTNMDAWGHGASTENTDFHPTRNPWDISRSPGGSSGGAAAAISSRMAVFAIGEDTGGSIRNPSAWCGITGLKVSYGLVSRYGTIAYASSLDTVGPMAKTAQDCAQILEVIAGKDPYDATSSKRPVPQYSKELVKDLKGISLGLPKEFYTDDLDKEILESIRKASTHLQSLGITIKEISLPLFNYCVPLYYILAPSETSSNLARYDGIRYGNNRSNFTKESARRIMTGTYVLSAGYYDVYYRQAQKGRTLFIKAFEKALSTCDVLLLPVTSTPPLKIGQLLNDSVKNMLMDIFTVSTNIVGVPALSLPCGITQNGLPIGMQFVGGMFSESLLLRLGHMYQQSSNWPKMKPKLSI